MKVALKILDSDALFIITDLDPLYYPAMHQLYFQPIEDGFAKNFPANTPHLERIFSNFERYAEEMVRQTADNSLICWEKSLQGFLEYIEAQNINWYLVGSAALAVRGMHVMPHDIDIVLTDEGSTKRISDLLLDYTVEPMVKSENWVARWFMRAFFHARIEFVGEVLPVVDDDGPCDFGPMAASRLETIEWRGKLICVPPIDLMLEVTERRGLDDRATEIRRWKRRIAQDNS
jgi:hypothetical protein